MNELELFAHYYRRLGLNVTRISNTINQHNFHHKNVLKTPDHDWKRWLQNQQSVAEFDNINWTNATGVGTTVGFNNLVVIDIDGCADYDLLDELLKVLKLPKNYEWVITSGSKNGFHIIVFLERFEITTGEEAVTTFKPLKQFENRFEKIEFLWQTHVVLPPSVHSTGNKYDFLNCRIPLKAPEQLYHSRIKRLVVDFLHADFTEGRNDYNEEDFQVISTGISSDLENADYEKMNGKTIICVVDIETDGLTERVDNVTQYPKVVQVAWLLMDELGVIYRRYSSLLSGNFNSDNGTVQVNNITLEAISRVGNLPENIYKILISDLKISNCVVFHNSDFDLPILRHEFVRLGLQDGFRNKQIICTMKSSTNFCAIKSNYGDYKFPKLSELYRKIFGYDVFHQHNAESDVLITAKCFKELNKRGIITL